MSPVMLRSTVQDMQSTMIPITSTSQLALLLQLVLQMYSGTHFT